MNLKWEIRIFINHIRSIQRQDFPRVSTFVFLSFLRNRCWKGNVATIPHTQSILNPLTISRAIRANDLIKRMGFCRISTSPSSMPPLSPAQGVEFRSSRRPPIVHRNRSNVLTPRVITLLAPGNSRRTHRFLSNPPPPNLTLRPVSNEHVSVHVGKRDGNVRSNIVSPPFVFHANSTGMKRIRSNRWTVRRGRGWAKFILSRYIIPFGYVDVHVKSHASFPFAIIRRKCILAKDLLRRSLQDLETVTRFPS